MPCVIRTSNGSKTVTVKAFSTDLRSNSSSVQLRNYSSPSSRNVQQSVLKMTIQTKSPSNYLSLVKFLRESQLSSLNYSGKTNVLWPERNIAYEVFVMNVPRARRLSDVAPALTVTFGIITGLINTSTGSVTGDKGSDYLIQEWYKEGNKINDLILQGSPPSTGLPPDGVFKPPNIRGVV